MARTLVIGDIHGHLVALDAVLAAAGVQRDDTVVTLGDYVDRGPNSRGVLDRLIALQGQCKLVPVLGNHEELMLAAYRMWGRGKGMIDEWLMNGGDKTLESYSGEAHGEKGKSPTLADVPAEHWLFLNMACWPYYETRTHVYVHASVLPDVPMEQQPKHVLRWLRFDDPPRHMSGKVMVCGHTPQMSGIPRCTGHAVCLDTGIHVGRVLTCLEAETGRMWQANAKGRTREGRLEGYVAE